MRRVRSTVVAGALALAVTGCSSSSPSVPAASPVGSKPASGAQSASTAHSGPSPSTDLEESEGPDVTENPGATQPLVIVMHATRPPLNVTRRVAQRVVDRDVRTWAQLTPARPRGSERPVTIVDSIRGVVRDRDAIAVLPASRVGPQVQAVTVDGVDPFRQPQRYPMRTGARSEAAVQTAPVVTMSIVGDIMLGRGVADAAARSGDRLLALRPMQRRLEGSDITVGNLESTLSRAGAPTQGDDSFAAAPAVARGLRDVGFDVLDLANNHLGDYGPRALAQTVRRLRVAGLDTFGAGANLREAWRPAVVTRDGVRFGFLGFNAIGETPEVGRSRPGAVSVSMPPRTGPLDRDELNRFLRAVRRLDRRVDVTVAMPHWGTQYTNVPEPVQRTVARRLVEEGADLVVGGHPHWVQGSAMVDDRLVVHSLGNFVFDMDFMDETMKGLLLELTYWGPELKAARFVPHEMDDRFAPRVESYADGLDTLRLMWETSGPAFRR